MTLPADRMKREMPAWSALGLMTAGGRRTTSAPDGSRERLDGLQPGRRQIWILTSFVVVLDVVLLGPLLRQASLQLLDFGDYPSGPHPPQVLSAYGFPPGLTSRAPIDIALYKTFSEVHWAPLHLLPFATVAPIACLSFARIFQHRPCAIGAATLLFTVNPFVYERLANGQVYVVMAYTLLLVLMVLIVRPLRSATATATFGGFVFALDAALSVHFLFIAAGLLTMAMLAHAVVRERQAILTSSGIIAVGVVLSLYWLIPAARATSTMRSHVTRADLAVFHTVADHTWGLGVNVFGLYGFWRQGPPLVKSQLSGWPILLAAILVIGAFGVHELVRGRHVRRRALAIWSLMLCLAGGLLAIGAAGPTGGIYVWLFLHLPGFKVMREPEKFSALIALGYCVLFGAGADAIVHALDGRLMRALCACCVAAVPVGYGYTELWGLSGSAQAAGYPASWSRADRAMPAGATALALPWRGWLQVPWDGDRVVANPMPSYFARPVISADDLEAGPITTETSNPRSLFLQFCLSHASHLTEFGRILAPLGIRDIILAKVPGSRSYGWLDSQHDLKRVFNSNSIAVYQNEERVPRAYEPHKQIIVGNWGEVLALGQHEPLIDYLIKVRSARPGPVRDPLTQPSGSVPPPTLVSSRGMSPAAVAIDVSAATRTVVLTNPAYAGWRMPGFSDTSQFGVTVAFTRTARARRAERVIANYVPWRLVEECDAAGVILVVTDISLLALSLFRGHRRAAASIPIGRPTPTRGGPS